MPSVEMVLEYKDRNKPPSAETILKAASLTLRLLRSIERNLTGKRASIHWTVDVAMHFSTAVISFDASSKRTDVAESVAKEAQGHSFDFPGVA